MRHRDVADGPTVRPSALEYARRSLATLSYCTMAEIRGGLSALTDTQRKRLEARVRIPKGKRR